MIKSMLIAAFIAVPSNLLCSPILAEEITSPKTTAIPMTAAWSSAPTSAVSSSNIPPALSLYAVNINNNISCRAKARAKYFELGARDMSNDTSNAQWGTIGNMQAVVWCRDSQAVIAVAGNSYDSVKELRDELAKSF